MIMATKPEFLVAKEDILVAIGDHIGRNFDPCKSKELNWPFFHFLGVFSDYNIGLSQWHGLAETLL